MTPFSEQLLIRFWEAVLACDADHASVWLWQLRQEHEDDPDASVMESMQRLVSSLDEVRPSEPRHNKELWWLIREEAMRMHQRLRRSFPAPVVDPFEAGPG